MADIKYVTFYKDCNKESEKRWVVKKTTTMPFATRMIWEAGQSAEYMKKLDEGVRNVSMQPLNPVRMRQRAFDRERQGQRGTGVDEKR